ncbi:MAG: hypothetical protein B7Y96_06165, partial [Comamonadaceae bacterium 32-67-11]
MPNPHAQPGQLQAALAPHHAWLQYALPKQALTELAGALARRPLGAATQWAMRRFAARYRVDMSEALQPDFGAYATFNDFFTRALKPGVRPLAESGL